MSVYRDWDIKEAKINEELINAAYGSKILARLLANRGINTAEKANKFLNPEKIQLSSPNVFTDIEKAIERIKTAITNQETIVVWGDFDADGITSTAIMYLTLKEVGANVEYYLPDRATESHGLNNKALINLISKKKAKLIITVDCGISNIQEVNLAKGLRCDVIITDHHEAPETLPNALAIINPKAKNSLTENLDLEEIESLNYLSGAGVAFKFACKILEMYKKETFVHELLPLAATGTIGDVVELIGENRRLVQMGLELIRQGKNTGLKQILKTSGVENINEVTSETIAYYVVPRINAAGRLESPITAIKALISDDIEIVKEAAQQLNDFNRLRQEICEQIFSEAQTMYENNIEDNKKSIILFNENWHVGVIGIVCSKLTEYYNKPAFLMTRDANNSNIIRCSSRSIEGINIHSVLSNHKEIFEGFGGHKMAAGFSFDENKISFDKFKKLLNETIEEYTQNIDFSKSIIHADMEVEINDITQDCIKLIDKLQPFGAANPSVLFVIKDVNLENYKLMGQNSNHLKIFVSKNNSNTVEGIKWNYPDFNLPINSKLDILFSPQINEFNGNQTIQYILTDIHSEQITKNTVKNETKILDHRNKTNILNQVLDFISTTKKKTAIYLQTPALRSSLNISETISDKIFCNQNIPNNIEQLMFFECPSSKEIFYKIINKTGADIVHLMNFGTNETSAESFITKLSGMLKYALHKLNGDIDIIKISNALNTETDTVECALSLFDNCGMINANKISDVKYKITKLIPLEISKLKNDDLYLELEDKIKEANEFKKYYLKTPIEKIKENITK